MIDLVYEKKTEIAELCNRLSVRRLDIFGSAVREDFDPERSDIDFLVEFADHTQPGILDRYLALAENLETLLSRQVDLVTVQSVKSPRFRSMVESTKQPVYVS